MKTKTKLIAFLAVLMTVCAMAFVGCGAKTENRKLSFEVDGEIYQTVETDGKSAVELPADPAKTGYTFGGWFYDKDVWEKPFTATSPVEEPLTADLTVYAKWNVQKCSVTFVSDGKTVKTETVEYGKSATAPEVSKTGHTFDGWDKEFDNVTEDLTVTAKWTINTYTVTLNANDATACNPLTSYTYGTETQLPVPEKTGHTFGGWYASADFAGEAVTAISATDTGNKEFFAKWTINTYTVKFISDGEEVKTETVDYGKSATAPEVSKIGHTFAGWDKEFDNVTEDLTVTAKWTVSTFTVKFISDGEEVKTETVEYGKSATAPEVSKTGHTFDGWDKAFDNVTEDLTVTAKWTINTYTVKFVSDGEEIKTETVEYGKSATAPEVTKTGHAFAGWDKAFDNVTEDLTVTAKWTINTYTVKFISDGEEVKTETVEYGKSATAPEVSKIGYTFSGWDKVFDNITEDLTVTAKWTVSTFTVKFVSDGEEIKTETVEYGKSATAPEVSKTGHTFDGWDKAFDNVTEDLTVTAKWTANTYAVTLNANDATACNPLTSYTYGTETQLPVPEKTGHTFGGWYASADFAGEAVTAISATDTGNKEFFAKWTINTYTVKFISDGEEVKTETVEYGKSATAPEVSKTGHTFAGWDKEFDNVTEDLTVTAKWTINTYTVKFVSDEETVKTETVEYGKSATAPEVSKTGYTFSGWDKAFDNITEDLTVTANWTINTYTIRFINADGEELKSEEVEYNRLPAYDGVPALDGGSRWVYTFDGWNKEIVAATEDAVYVATYTKAENPGNLYQCTFNDGFTDHVFENSTFTGNAEWNVTLTAKDFYHKGGVKLVSDTGSFISLANDQSQATYMQYNEDNTVGYSGGTQKGGSGEFTMTFKFVKLDGKIYGYIDGRALGTYDATVATDMFDEHELHLATYRGTAVTGDLTFKASATTHVYAIDGTTRCADKFDGLTAAGDFTFTAGVQGTGLYTEAGIRIWCGENFIDFFSHTYGGNSTVVRFGNTGDGADGWNAATVLATVNIANAEKGLYKVVKTSEKLSLYLNDTLIFEFDRTFALAREWGSMFFAADAVYSFGRYVLAGPGGSGFYTDVDLDATENAKFAVDGSAYCADKFDGYKAAEKFTFTATLQGTGLYTEAGIRIWCGDNFIDFYCHTYGGNSTTVRFGNTGDGADGWNSVQTLATVNIANADKAVYKVVKTAEKLSLYVNDTLIFEFDKDFVLAREWGSMFFEEGAVYTFGQYVTAGLGGTGFYTDLGIEY